MIRDDRLVEAFIVHAQTGSMRHTDGSARWVTAIASLMVGNAFFALWFWLLPSGMAGQKCLLVICDPWKRKSVTQISRVERANLGIDKINRFRKAELLLLFASIRGWRCSGITGQVKY